MKGMQTGSAASSRGFTLIELIVVVAIVLILAGAAVPNILGSIQRGRVQTAALQVGQDLRLVRENAILYQADLYFYVSSETGANMRYWYEQLPLLESNGLPAADRSITTNRYLPPVDGAASPDSSRFIQGTLPFNMHVVSVSSSVSSYTSVAYNGHAYYEICFRSGKDDSVIPGSVAVSPVTIVVGDSSGHQWRVVVDAIGRPHISQVTS